MDYVFRVFCLKVLMLLEILEWFASAYATSTL